VQDILVNAFEEKQHTFKWQWKEDRDRQTVDWQQTVSTLCTSNP